MTQIIDYVIGLTMLIFLLLIALYYVSNITCLIIAIQVYFKAFEFEIEQMFLGRLFVNCQYYLGKETEPIRSKFDYEIKTLEKMVRIEHAME